MFMNEPNDVTPLRKRREADEPKIEEGSLMIFSVSHLTFLGLSFGLKFLGFKIKDLSMHKLN